MSRTMMQVQLYLVPLNEVWTDAILVNGEAFEWGPSISHGFVHFMDPDTGMEIGHSGVNWFQEHYFRLGTEILPITKGMTAAQRAAILGSEME